MTTKHLRGAYPSGYMVASNVTYIDIESTASIGGTGVSTQYTNALQITNNGTIQAATGNGVTFNPVSGTLINGLSNPAALIEGSENGISTNAAVTNFGTVEGRGASGVVAIGSVNNFGTIEGFGAGFGHAGIRMIGSSVTNGSSGEAGALIEGYSGIIGVWSTITNFGSIAGMQAVGIFFNGQNGLNSVAVTNGSQTDHAASIQGTTAGISLQNTIATLTNWGTISTAGYDGVALLYGGLIDNYGAISSTGRYGRGIAIKYRVNVVNGSAGDLTASIAGVAYGITTQIRSPTTIVNYGTVRATGTAGYGVNLYNGSLIRNGSMQDTSALIRGGKGGVFVRGDRTTIVNYGTVTGGSAGGVWLRGDHDVAINGSADDAAALIGGGASLAGGAGDTVVNYGTISGLTLTSASDVLKVEAGCVFESPVSDAGTLALVNGTGTLSGLSGGSVTVSGSMAAATFSGFAKLTIAKTARFAVSGPATIAAGQALRVGGALTVTDSLVVAGAAKGGGVIHLSAHATATFDGAAPASLEVTFQGYGARLNLQDAAAFAATIGAFNRRGRIDLIGVAATAATLGAGDKLTIMNGATTVAVLQLAGAFGGETFAVRSDGSGGTLITVSRAHGAASPAPPHALIAAAAALGAPAAAALAPPLFHPGQERLALASPRGRIA